MSSLRSLRGGIMLLCAITAGIEIVALISCPRKGSYFYLGGRHCFPTGLVS